MKRSSKRQAVIDAINNAGKPIGPREIASVAGMPAQNVRQLLPKLVAEMVIEKTGYGKYCPVPKVVSLQDLHPKRWSL